MNESKTVERIEELEAQKQCLEEQLASKCIRSISDLQYEVERYKGLYHAERARREAYQNASDYLRTRPSLPGRVLRGVSSVALKVAGPIFNQTHS